MGKKPSKQVYSSIKGGMNTKHRYKSVNLNIVMYDVRQIFLKK